MDTQETIDFVVMKFNNDINNLTEQKNSIVKSNEDIIAGIDGQIADIQAIIDSLETISL